MAAEVRQPLLEADVENIDKCGTPSIEGEEDDDGDTSLLSLFTEAFNSIKDISPADLLACFPAASWLPKYFTQNATRNLLKDLQCGITVAAVCVPQGMAYGMLAEVPPVHGLYTALLPAIAYTAFGSCLHLSVGPFALIAMLVGQGVLRHNPDDDPLVAVEVASILALMSGLILIMFGLLRLGFIATFLSDPVLSGFCTASALIIPTSQLKYAFQVQVANGTFTQMIWGLAEKIHDTNFISLSIFITSLLAIFGIQKLNSSPPESMSFLKKFPLPAELIVLVVSTAGCAIFDLGRCPGPCVKQLGSIPPGLPALSFPPVTKYDLADFASDALLIAIMTYIISMSVSKTFGRKYGYEVSNDQELMALGMANVFGSASGCFPPAASLSRTAIAGAVGAVSPMHNVFTVLAVAMVLQFFVALVAPLPNAVLAAIVVMAFKSLLLNGLAECRWSVGVSSSDFFIWQIAFWATLTQSVSTGILLPVIADMVHLLYKTTRPNTAVLGRLQDRLYRNIENFPDAKLIPGVLVFRFNSALHFANREVFASKVWEAIHSTESGRARSSGSRTSFLHALFHHSPGGQKEKIEALVIDGSPMTHVDLSACRTLDKLRRELAARGTRMVMAHVNFETHNKMMAMGIFDALDDHGEKYDVVAFRDLHDAVVYAEGTMAIKKSMKARHGGKRTSVMEDMAKAGADVGFVSPIRRAASTSSHNKMRRASCGY